jgi:hypothetical protein
MKLIGVALFILSTLAHGQEIDIKVSGCKTSIYRDAITCFIDSVHSYSKLSYDTLYVLSSEDFTESGARNIEGIVKKLDVVFLDTANVSNLLKYQKSLIAINVSANTNLGKERINILIYSFLVTTDKVKTIYIPLKSCSVNYYYNKRTKEFEFKKIVIE